ncbi:kinase-like domain-containing protein [Mycena sp. CBHHK59/15]|nr:kinase-like domain-containing protein [Mycena sp. CBHHK59/15]
MPVQLPPEETHLTKLEIFWRDHQSWLAGCGYMLRPRYMPEWVPSWLGNPSLSAYMCEDGQMKIFGQVMDATRTSDGKLVALKRVDAKIHPFEAEIQLFLCSEPLAKDPRNHCSPIYEVLRTPDDPDVIILVMPFLRPFDDPNFDTFGEAVDFFQQIFEGLDFMHEHGVAHRDCGTLNVMIDASGMYPEPFHPIRLYESLDLSHLVKGFTRTQHPPKYYLIDFGISRRYKPEQLPILEDIILGGDKSPPEFQNSYTPCDPFPTDIYYIGNLIRENFIDGSDDLSVRKKLGFGFMKKLVDDMIQEDPTKRPTSSEVLSRFKEIKAGLSSWKLRSRVVHRRKIIFPLDQLWRHWHLRMGYIFRGTPAIPSQSFET